MKRNRIFMYAIALFQGMVFYGPIATLYRQAQGVSVFEITFIEGISLALSIILEIPWGVAADKIGYRRTMIVCNSLYFVSKIIFWKADGFGGFLLERILLSIVAAGISGVDTSILYLSCKGQDSQRVFGIYNSMGMAGLLAAAAVFSFFVRDQYSLAGLLTVISYGISAVLSFFLRETKEEGDREPTEKSWGSTGKRVVQNRHFLLFLIGVAFLSDTHQTITVFLNQIQYVRCGLGNTAIGMIYLAATFLGVCGFCSSVVTTGMGQRGSFLFFCGIEALACMTLAITRSAGLSVAGIFALRITNSLFQPFQAEIQNRQIRYGNRATALSVYAMIVDGIAIGTNLMFGGLAQISLSLAFCFGAGICMMGLLCFWKWSQKEQEEM